MTTPKEQTFPRKAETLSAVKHAAGEQSDRADFRAEGELQQFKADTDEARERLRHAGNRKNWPK